MEQNSGISKVNCIGRTAQQLNIQMEQKNGILKIKGTGRTAQQLNGMMEQNSGISMVKGTGRTAQQLNIQMGQNHGTSKGKGLQMSKNSIVFNKISSNLERKLKTYEFIQLAKFCKQYGVDFVYDVCNSIEIGEDFIRKLKEKLSNYQETQQIETHQDPVGDLIAKRKRLD